MTRDDLRLLFDYNDWANRRILAAAGGLSAEEYAVALPGMSMGSVRATLVHMLAAQRIWRQRCFEGVSPTALLREAECPTFDGLRRLWAEEEAALRAGLDGPAGDDPDRRVAYRTTDGTPKKETLWQLLAHLVNHGTQHRAEAAVALTAFGCSPGDVDLIVYLRQR